MLLYGYCQGNHSQPDVQEMLGIGKNRFFGPLKAFRQDPHDFTIVYQRSTQGRLTPETKKRIKQELLGDKVLIND